MRRLLWGPWCGGMGFGAVFQGVDLDSICACCCRRCNAGSGKLSSFHDGPAGAAGGLFRPGTLSHGRDSRDMDICLGAHVV